MKRLLRVTTAITAILAVALQLPLAGDTAACKAQMESHMAGMAQSAPMAGDSDHGSDALPSMSGMAESYPSGGPSPCDDDIDRGACIDMAACISSLTIPSETSPANGQLATLRVVTIAVSEPASLSLPPEPPPPRA